MNQKIFVLSALWAAGLQTAAANEIGFYIGGYVGQASKDVPRVPLEEFTEAIHQLAVFTPLDEQTSLDETDTAFALIGGYRWNRYLAFEAGYARLGEATYRSRATGEFPLESGSLDTYVASATSGFTVSALGTLALTRDWEVYARGGVLFASNELKVVLVAQGRDFIPPIGNRAADSFSQSSTDPYAALGISRRILEIYDLRLEYQRVFDAGLEVTGAQGDVDVALLGLTVTF